MTRILLISGSTRDDSLQTAALRTAARFAPEDINAGLFEGLRGVPAFVPGEENPHDTVVLLRHQVRIADAILISTPEYAGTIPGSLKNLLDWLLEDDLLDGKPVAWLSVSGEGEDYGARTTLETVLGHTNAKVLKGGVHPGSRSTRPAVDRSGLVTDPRVAPGPAGRTAGPGACAAHVVQGSAPAGLAALLERVPGHRTSRFVVAARLDGGLTRRR